ncbi:hypothetical protein, partial [Sulfitobacter geojensis]
MTDEAELTYYERRLVAEIEGLTTRIRELEDERRALQRLLANAKGRDRIIGQVKRKNSVDRVLVEATIIDALTKAEKPLSSSDLFKAVSSVVFSTNENTFRSHLHRMKTKGKIVNYRNIRGRWIMPSAT